MSSGVGRPWMRLIFFATILSIWTGLFCEVGHCAKSKASSSSSSPSSNSVGSFIDPLKHDIFQISHKTIDSTINKFRDSVPASVLYYSEGDLEAKSIIDTFYNESGTKLKGMVKVAAMDCNVNRVFCEKMKIAYRDTEDKSKGVVPSLMIMPVMPMSTYLYEGNMKSDGVSKFVKHMTSMIPNGPITTLTSMVQVEEFLSQHVALPKVFLFSDKNRTSPMVNALSLSFKDKVLFGFVPEGAAGGVIAKRFYVKKYPTLLIKAQDMTASGRGAVLYDGPLTFTKIHEWINIRSETFVKGGGFSADADSSATAVSKQTAKIWLSQRVPEMTKQSYNDICFRKKSGFCLVYLKDEAFDENHPTAVTLSESERHMLEDIEEIYGSSSKQKHVFHVSWMNLGKETKFRKLFGFDESETGPAVFPSVAVFNPHKKIRFMLHPSGIPATRESIQKTIHTILANEGRFKIVKGNKLPAFYNPTPSSTNNTPCSSGDGSGSCSSNSPPPLSKEEL